MGVFDFLKPKPLEPPRPVEPGTLLVVEDVFEIQNVGPVVVGVTAEPITAGQTAVLRSGEAETPIVIASIEKRGQKSDSCQPGEAVGLVLQGIEYHHIAYGDSIMTSQSQAEVSSK